MKKISSRCTLLMTLLCLLTAFGCHHRTIEQDALYLTKLTNGAEAVELQYPNIIKSMKEFYPNVPQDFWEDLEEEKQQMIQEMTTGVASIYVSHFDEAEIKKLIRFYESPIGQKFKSVQMDYLNDFYTLSMEVGQTFADRVKKKLQEKGY